MSQSAKSPSAKLPPVKSAPAKSSKSIEQEMRLPSRDEVYQNYSLACQDSLQNVRQTLCHMQPVPPQVLLIEGGTVAERLALALWQAAYLNCTERLDDGCAPCLSCHSCVSIGALLAPDLHLLDGRTESIKIATIRALRPLFGEAPHGLYRVVILAEAQALGMEAANALLKSLEEPLKYVCFLLLTPQREQLLPTLISRSWVLTLPWPAVDLIDSTMAEWENILSYFLETGQGLFAHTSAKGAISADLVRRVVLLVQKTFVTLNAQRPCGKFGALLSKFSPAACLHVQDAARQAELSLEHKVRPSLVLEWFAMQLFLTYKQSVQMNANKSA